jgi:hypothetical protein
MEKPNTYGDYWESEKASYEWYYNMGKSRPNSHQEIINYCKKKNIKNILEIGGGADIIYSDILKCDTYINMDISKKALSLVDKKKKIIKICDDICRPYNNLIANKYNFDFVFSTGVIDHVYDIDMAIKNHILLTNKYVYIVLYYGYFDNIDEHQQSWNNHDTCFYNKCSISKLNNTLKKYDNYNYEIKKFITTNTQTGKVDFQQEETHIILEKKNT